jgi:hypothetical protein
VDKVTSFTTTRLEFKCKGREKGKHNISRRGRGKKPKETKIGGEGERERNTEVDVKI